MPGERLDQRDARDRRRCGRSTPGSAAGRAAWRRRRGPGSAGRRGRGGQGHAAGSCGARRVVIRPGSRRTGRRGCGGRCCARERVADVDVAAAPRSSASIVTHDVVDLDARLPAGERGAHLVARCARPSPASAGAKTKSWMPHPNSGRIGRSPGAVPRISRMLSSSSRSRRDQRDPSRSRPCAAGMPSRQPTKSSLTARPSPDQDRGDGRRELARRGAAGAARLRGRRRLAAEQHGRAAAQHPADLEHRRRRTGRWMEPDVRRRVVARAPMTAAGLPPMSTVGTAPG